MTVKVDSLREQADIADAAIAYLVCGLGDGEHLPGLPDCVRGL